MPTSRKRHGKMPAFDKFDPFDMFVRKIASQYHLGPKGRSLVRETFELITAHPGGLGGFLDRFKAAGRAAEAALWEETADPVPVSEQDVEQALGAEVIAGIAGKAGVSQGFATTVLGKTIPEIVCLLVESGLSGEVIPPQASMAEEIAQRQSERIPPVIAAERSAALPRGWWLVPGAALVIVLGIAGYFLVPSRGTSQHVAAPPAGSGPVIAQNAPAPITQAPSQNEPAAAAAANAAAANERAAQTAAASPAATPEPGGKEPTAASSQAAPNLPAIYFAQNSVKVSPASKAALREVAGLIKNLPRGSVVWVSGYPSGTGNSASNLKLSRRRASSVRKALVEAGVSPAMLIAKGYGSSPPPNSGKETSEGGSSVVMKGQPRVEFRIVQQ